MKKEISDLLIISLLSVISVLAIVALTKAYPFRLFFVDAARYADVARNILESGILASKFNFPTTAAPSTYGWLINLPPVHIIMISLFFQLFGVGDKAVIFESAFFFILGVPLIYLLGKKIYNQKVAVFSALSYIFTSQLIFYAKDGASEPLFITQLLFTSYLIVLNKRWSLLIAGLVSAIMLLTKLQAYLFVPIFIVWILLLNISKPKNIQLYLIGPMFLALFNLLGFSFYNYHPDIPLYLSFQQTTLFPGDNLARSGQIEGINGSYLLSNLKTFLSKVIYNIYNFYKTLVFTDKNLPDFAPSIFIVSAVLSLFNLFKKEDSLIRVFKLMVVMMIGGSIILASATSPSVRYLHLTLPFVIILGIGYLDEIFVKLFGGESRVKLVLAIILIIFLIGPFLGITIIDSRFLSAHQNIGKPYSQEVLGRVLGSTTDKQGVVATNLDTWGSWYGNRNTMLIPLNLQQLQTIDKTNKIQAIFLTDFQKDNSDHPITGDWDLMMKNADFPDNFIKNNFIVTKQATISASQVYDNRDYHYIIWTRK